MKFLSDVLKNPNNEKKLLEIVKFGVCDSCLGRQFGMLGHGMTNAERGKELRKHAEELMKTKLKEPDVCRLCNNFFTKNIDKVAKSIAKKLQNVEFETFLIGSVVPGDLSKRQEELWEKIGIEDVESIKSEINRELGKRVEKLTKKLVSLKAPDLTILADLENETVRIQIRSLYIFGKYQKLVRGIPQTKWICSRCGGKGCKYCKGRGKLYPTSVQEIIEKPLLKVAKAKKSKFSGMGREDIDARCLDYRPFVIELIKPLKRKIDLKKIEKEINKSKKVKVKELKFTTKELIRKIKTERVDKTYVAEVKFKNKIDRKKLPELKKITAEAVLQKTPLRVVHRRADKFRKRKVKKISWKIKGKKIVFKITAESGLYVKELITGDEGRTKPSIADLLNNKVEKITLDVVKIHYK